MTVNPIRAPAAAPFTPVQAREVRALTTFARSRIESAAEATAAAETAPAANPNIVALRAYFAAETDEAAKIAIAGLDDASRAEVFTDLYARLGGVPVEGHDVAADHFEATPRSELAQAAAQALLNRLAPVVVEVAAPVDAPALVAATPAETTAAPAEAAAAQVEAPKGFFARVCDKITSFFTGIANWFASLFTVTAVPAEEVEPAPATLVSSVKEFQASVNAEGATSEGLTAAYTALCAAHAEAKDKIEYGIYVAAQAAGDDVSSHTFGTDYIAATPAGAHVKAALTAYVAELEAAPVVVEVPAARTVAA